MRCGGRCLGAGEDGGQSHQPEDSNNCQSGKTTADLGCPRECGQSGDGQCHADQERDFVRRAEERNSPVLDARRHSVDDGPAHSCQGRKGRTEQAREQFSGDHAGTYGNNAGHRGETSAGAIAPQRGSLRTVRRRTCHRPLRRPLRRAVRQGRLRLPAKARPAVVLRMLVRRMLWLRGLGAGHTSSIGSPGACGAGCASESGIPCFAVAGVVRSQRWRSLNS